MGFEPTYLVVCNLVRQYMDPFQACLLLIAVAKNKFVYIQLKLKTIEPIKYFLLVGYIIKLIPFSHMGLVLSPLVNLI